MSGFGPYTTWQSATKRAAAPEVRPKCPYCGSSAIRTMTVPWYRELEYLTCDSCKSIWTIQRKPQREGR